MVNTKAHSTCKTKYLASLISLLVNRIPLPEPVVTCSLAIQRQCCGHWLRTLYKALTEIPAGSLKIAQTVAQTSESTSNTRHVNSNHRCRDRLLMSLPRPNTDSTEGDSDKDGSLADCTAKLFFSEQLCLKIDFHQYPDSITSLS